MYLYIIYIIYYIIQFIHNIYVTKMMMRDIQDDLDIAMKL